MASKSSADLTNTSSSFDSSTATSKVSCAAGLPIQYQIHTEPLILQFTVVFRNDMDMIEVSSFYHRQWAPDYLELMACIADKIKTIDGSKETLKLAVRITDLWFVGTPGRSEQAEKIIVDSDGDQIHVVCKQDQLKAWKMDLKEGCSYVMHNFKVTKNDGQYRCGLDGVPLKKYRFVDFSDIIAGQLQFDLLVDIIGVVDEVVFRHISPRSKRVVFKLMNLSNELVSCTLWDDYCVQFLEYLDQHENEGPIIVLLTNARIKEGQGYYPCLVSNSLKASTLTINEPLSLIEEFNQKLSELGIEIRSILTRRSQWSSQPSGSAQLPSRETFISMSEAKSISEINNLCKEFVCVTVGTITRILMDNHSWCYPSCIQCYKKIDVYPEPFVCPCGKHNDRAVLRYRVEVMVNYKDENTKFLLWNCECTELIGQSADEVNTLKIEDGDLDLNASPKALDKLLGHLFTFKVKIQPQYKNSTVLKCSSDLTLINDVLDMLPDVETCSKIEATTSFDSNDPVHDECQFISITADHDPLIGLPLTPTKRQPFNECDDEARSSQISPAQLSNMENHRFISKSDLAKARSNRKRIRQQKVHLDVQHSVHASLNPASSHTEDDYNQPKTPPHSVHATADRAPHDAEDHCFDIQTVNPRIMILQWTQENPPKFLQQLLFEQNTAYAKNYQQNIRTYNMMFAFTSTGIKFDKTIGHSRGPPTIRIQGQPYHRIGSLLPMPGKEPKFAQLYIYETENEVQNRINIMSHYNEIEAHIVSNLQKMLDENNVHAKSFRMARDRLSDTQVHSVGLKLIVGREKDGRTYNIPSVLEVAALIVRDIDANSNRDIFVETQNGQLQRIHELHCSYLALQYPLLFPYGEDGYRTGILHRDTLSGKRRKRNRLTMREPNEGQTLLHSRKLFQQFVAEGYTMIESERLSYVRNNQKKLRVDNFCSLQQSSEAGNIEGLGQGKRIILPSTFVGSPHYMDQLYFDGIAICSHVGFPNLFITFTCNPNWPEIHRLLTPLNLTSIDKPEIISRIFKLKYEQMLSDLTKNHLLGKDYILMTPI
ncbi:Replication protein A DNA-binding subunit B [Glycine max]|nr:Replication protein A DNA-binding subunit B [Glycine max]